jgi:predicted nucleic acid-binding protein
LNVNIVLRFQENIALRNGLLAKLRYWSSALQVLTSLEADPSVEVVPSTEELYHEAFQLYRDRADKEWGLVDCVSFVIMRERGLTEALTPDRHFEQAGFRALLCREEG